MIFRPVRTSLFLWLSLFFSWNHQLKIHIYIYTHYAVFRYSYKTDSNRHTFPLYFMCLLLVPLRDCHPAQRYLRPSLFLPFIITTIIIMAIGCSLFGLMDPSRLLVFVSWKHDSRSDLMCSMGFSYCSQLGVSSSSLIFIYIVWPLTSIYCKCITFVWEKKTISNLDGKEN